MASLLRGNVWARTRCCCGSTSYLRKSEKNRHALMETHARCHLNALTAFCCCCDLDRTARDRKNIELGVGRGKGASVKDPATRGCIANSRQKSLDKQIFCAPKRVLLTKGALSTISGLQIVAKARNNCAYAKLRADWHAIVAVKNGYALR